MSTTSSGASSAIDALVAFCAAHPIPDTDSERFLRHLNSGAPAIVDLRERGIVCVILDRARSGANCAPLELVGCRPGALDDAAAREIVRSAAAKGRALGLGGLDLMLGEEWKPHGEAVAAEGFRFAYRDLDMRCAVPDWGEDRAIPEGYVWRDLAPDLIDGFLRMQRAAFTGLPGVYFPDAAEQRRVLETGIGAVRILTAGDQVAAALRFSRADGFLHSIVRDPAVKGRGFGRLVLDEARRQLPGRGLELNVVSSNRTAVDLYARHGFAVMRAFDVLSLDLRA